jgi:hypothetical protein
MTTMELSLRRDYLSQHRRMIIGRSIAASMAGLVPVPFLEEWLTSTIKRSTIRRIAAAREVDLDDEAVRAIADGPSTPPQWAEVAGGTLIYKLASKAWRRLLYAYVAARRTQAAARNFEIATLFDHYCARLHVGMGLNGEQAMDLRQIMTDAIEQTPGALVDRAFRRAAIATGRATVQAPVELLDIATGGAVRRLLSRGSDEVTAVEEVDQALEAQIHSQQSFLARAATAVELQLSAEANPYVDDVIDTFERLWRGRAEVTEKQ